MFARSCNLAGNSNCQLCHLPIAEGNHRQLQVLLAELLDGSGCLWQLAGCRQSDCDGSHPAEFHRDCSASVCLHEYGVTTPQRHSHPTVLLGAVRSNGRMDAH